MIDINNFNKLEIRVGEILRVELFPEAITPAYKLKIDFGDYGIKWSSAQITNNYSVKELQGRQIIAVMNL
ncbi:MAG: tRNA-binding protein, partial [Candidatus Marinimicrobia bacterium]|nr:tRNA-binding protein [Candidatus Neomarinimicrobiota bacterium]